VVAVSFATIPGSAKAHPGTAITNRAEVEVVNGQEVPGSKSKVQSLTAEKQIRRTTSRMVEPLISTYWRLLA